MKTTNFYLDKEKEETNKIINERRDIKTDNTNLKEHKSYYEH